jgi:hypothetical protein
MNTTDKIALFALVIAFASAIFSWFSFSKSDELAQIAFNKNYRPYISAASFSYIDQKDGKSYPNMNVVLIKTLNAPASMTNKKLTFYTREKNIDSLLFEQLYSNLELIYPLDNSQITISTGDNIINNTIAKNILPKELIRKIRIEYQWISDNTLKYYFESEWKYNVEKQDWDVISQNAN